MQGGHSSPPAPGARDLGILKQQACGQPCSQPHSEALISQTLAKYKKTQKAAGAKDTWGPAPVTAVTAGPATRPHLRGLEATSEARAPLCSRGGSSVSSTEVGETGWRAGG